MMVGLDTYLFSPGNGLRGVTEMMCKTLVVVLVVVALVAAGLGTGRVVHNNPPAVDSSDEFMIKLRYETSSDEFMIKLRYETSSDLVPELDGFHTGQVYNVRCEDGVTRPVRVALLDRGLSRAGIILVQARSPVGGNLGGVAYDPKGMGFVRLVWLRDHLE